MIQINKAYSRAAIIPTFLKKLMNITGMSEQSVAARIKQKRGSNASFGKVCETGSWYIQMRGKESTFSP
ncbi:hypothetical protein Godav_022951 [Gossypium davidsonii]|uniref:Uncharacterized protein n=2 Tax=Gossypium TaxID=3633 RepID=A0A7J8SPX6_GOSDV|nr:hypothetical protein [Gossypium davidsonii]MBA0628185.1 hypothetical protein [Gossypium davidsonii]MBA0663895.1 hypothetical protein [Gossypium klotzschianum]